METKSCRVALTALLLICLRLGPTEIAEGAIPTQRPWPSDGLVGHWDFTSGITTDKTGSWGAMTLTGGVYSTGTALQLRGSDVTSTQHASVSGYTGPELRSKTIVSRLKMVDRDAARSGSLGSVTSSDELVYDAIEWEGYGENSFFLGSDGGVRTDNTEPYTWTHNNIELTVAVVMTEEGGSTKVQMYVDGFLRRDYSKPSVQSYAGTGVKLLWGVRHSGYGAVSADVYETRLYNRALRESEIVQIVPVQESAAGNFFRARYIDGYPSLTNARRMCRANGLHLAQIRSAAENDEAYSIRDSVDYFLSGSDRITEGSWVWEDGPGAGVTFYTQAGHVCNQGWCNWSQDEPNDFEGAQDAMHVYIDKTWDDYQDFLGIDRDWMCQRESPEAESKFFKTYAKRKRMSLDYGLAFCAGLGGYLATITTSEEAEELYAILIDAIEYLVAGSDAAVEGEWRWMAGEEKGHLISNGSSCAQSWCGWFGIEPNNNDDEYELYVVKNSTTGELRWNDNRGTREGDQGIVCEFRDTRTQEMTGTASPTTSMESTPSKTPSRTISPPATLSETRTPSRSPSSSLSWSASFSSSESQSRTLSFSPSLTPSISSSINLTASLQATSTASDSSSVTILGSSSVSMVATTSLSSSTTLPHTASMSLLATWSVSSSHTGSRVVTPSTSTIMTHPRTSTKTRSGAVSRSWSMPLSPSTSPAATHTVQSTVTNSTTETLTIGSSETESLSTSSSWSMSCDRPEVEVSPRVLKLIDLRDQSRATVNLSLAGNHPSHSFVADAMQAQIFISADSDWLKPELVAESMVVAPSARFAAFEFMVSSRSVKVYEAAILRVDIGWEAFACRSKEGASVLIEGRPVRRPVPHVAVNAIESVSMTTAAMSSVIGTPTIAVQQSRIAAVMSMASCQFSHNEPVHRFQSPLKWQVGDATGAYYRGALVGNFVIFLYVVVLSALFTLLLYNPSKQRGVVDSMRLLHLPGLWAVPIALLCQGTVSVATSLYNHGTHPIDKHLCWTTATIVILLWAVVMYLVTIGFQCESTVRSSVLHDPTQPAWKRCVILCLFSSTKWKDKPKLDKTTGRPVQTGFKQHWQALFIDYRDGYQWFFGFEMSLAILVGILEGMKDPDTCDAVLWAFIALVALHTGASVLLRPFAALFNMFFHITISIGTCLAVMFGAAGRAYNNADSDGYKNALAASQWCALIVQFVSVVKLGFDALMLFRWFHSRYLRDQRKRITTRVRSLSQAFRQPSKKSSSEVSVDGDDDGPADSLLHVLFRALDSWRSGTNKPPRRSFADAIEDFDEDLELLLLQHEDIKEGKVADAII